MSLYVIVLSSTNRLVKDDSGVSPHPKEMLFVSGLNPIKPLVSSIRIPDCVLISPDTSAVPSKLLPQRDLSGNLSVALTCKSDTARVLPSPRTASPAVAPAVTKLTAVIAPSTVPPLRDRYLSSCLCVMLENSCITFSQRHDIPIESKYFLVAIYIYKFVLCMFVLCIFI